MEMKSAFYFCLLISFGIAALADPVGATTLPTSAYIAIATCLNSTSGFTSKFEPKTEGTAWTETIIGAGSGTVSGNTQILTELDNSVISAVYGSKPSSHGPSANAFTQNITATATGPNSDGSYTVQFRTIGGTYTAGPNSGLTFTATTSGLTAKYWKTTINVPFAIDDLAHTGTPVVQTITLSNKTSYERICAFSFVITSPVTDSGGN
jgi:hypothetical protein